MQQLIAGRYDVDVQLGMGGMGTVYRATDRQNGQTVAVKALNASAYRPDDIERFRREGEALRELNHPNIIRLLDTVQDNGSHYLVMEYIAGGDLNRLLEQGRLEIHQILALALDLADALTRAHKLNIIHRDLKPANVLIGSDSILRLSDFGVARIASRQNLTATGALVGTIHYLAPEALNGDPVDPRVDIWSFGIMLFEMLTGERPFDGESMMLTIMSILTDELPDLEHLRPDAPAALVDLVYRMLVRNPQERIASVRLVGAELEAIARGQSTPAQRFDMPTPVVPGRPKHNLPAQMTPFVGREAELSELSALLSQPALRLVTIVAPGGMGKTRLSLEAAGHQLEQFKNGVYVVELAPLTDGGSLIPAIAEAVGYQFQTDERDMRRQLLDFFREKDLLLVMDNFEHLLDAAGMVTDILQAAPGVRILATSRQRLNLPGETLFYLSGMDFPAWETPADALTYAAVKLFMNSACRAQPGFELTANNLDAVARICRLVAGMPLGIVLAASWLTMLTPDEIAAEMQQSMDFLEAQSGSSPERQRSIRAVLDYAWQMMDADEQQVFIKLSVFRGGFTRQAAQTVTSATLRTLLALVTKSLLWRNSTSGRYSIHELLRQYAAEKLEATGSTSAIEDAHSAYYLNVLRERHHELEGPNGITFLHDIRDDYENVVRAVILAVQHDSLERLEETLYTLQLYYQYRAEEEAGIALFEQVASLASRMSSTDDHNPLSVQLLVRLVGLHGGAGHFVRADALLEEIHALADDTYFGNLRAYILWHQAVYLDKKEAVHQARPLYAQAATVFRQAGDRIGEIGAMRSLAFSYMGRREEAPDWQRAWDDLLPLYHLQIQQGNVIDIIWTLNGLGITAENREKSAEAGVQWYRESLLYAEKLGDQSTIALLTGNLAQTITMDGRFDEGLDYYGQCLAIARERGDMALTGWLMANVLTAYINLGRFADAEILTQEKLRLFTGTEYEFHYRWGLFHCGFVAEMTGDYETAQHWIQKAIEGELPENSDALLFACNLVFLRLASYQERWNDVLELTAQGKQKAEAVGNPEFLKDWHIAMAWLEYRRDALSNLEGYARLAVDYGRAHDYLSAEHDLHSSLVMLSIALSRQHQLDEGRSLAVEALQIAYRRKTMEMFAGSLLAVLELFLAEAKLLRAVSIAVLIEFDTRIGAPWHQDATHFLNKVQTMLDEGGYSAAVESGQQLKLEAVVQELLDEFTGSAS